MIQTKGGLVLLLLGDKYDKRTRKRIESFDLKEYIKTHPRMSYGEVIECEFIYIKKAL